MILWTCHSECSAFDAQVLLHYRKRYYMRIIVGVSGASGVEMSLSLLRALRNANCETYLVVTEGARLTWSLETDIPIEELYNAADHVYAESDYAAVIASGSFVTDGMIVMPCSMKTLAGIANGFAENLLLRAADVCLKENRRVVLVPREMPLGRVHLRNMLSACELGCAIVPPMLTFYNGADSLQSQIDTVVGKVLMQFSIIPENFKSWEGMN